MTITVLCPRGHAITLDAWPHRAIACPRCGAVFTARDAAGPASPSLPGAMAARSERRPRRDEEEDDEDDRPRRRKRRADDDEDEDKRSDKVRKGPPPKHRPVARRKVEEEPEEEEDETESVGPVLTRKQQQMAKVRIGILLHIIKLWIYLTALLFGFITLPLVLFIAAFVGGILGQLLLHTTYNLAMTIAPILGIVGSALCAFVPPRSEARGVIIVSLCFDALPPILGVFQLIMWIAYHGTGGDERVANLMSYLLYARLGCTLTAWWLFQLYLRKLAFYMRETLLASESLNVIVHLLMATVITPTLVIGMFVLLAVGLGGILLLILFFATVGWMIFFAITFPIRQFRLLFNVRSKIFLKYLKVDDDD